MARAPEVCNVCDEYNQHDWPKGQRRAQCDACGYVSHWVHASTFDPRDDDATYDGPSVGVSIGEYEGETRIGYAVSELKDPDSFRLSRCCYAPVRADLKGRP